MSRTLFVGNLNDKTSREALFELFAECGEVLRISIPQDRESGRRRGFAFVELGSPAAARQATQTIDGVELDGSRLRVSLAREDARPRQSRPPAVQRSEAETGEVDRPDFSGGGRGERPRWDDDRPKARGGWRDERHRRQHRRGKSTRDDGYR